MKYFSSFCISVQRSQNEEIVYKKIRIALLKEDAKLNVWKYLKKR